MINIYGVGENKNVKILKNGSQRWGIADMYYYTETDLGSGNMYDFISYSNDFNTLALNHLCIYARTEEYLYSENTTQTVALVQHLGYMVFLKLQSEDKIG